MKTNTTYRLGRKEACRNTIWSFMARDTNIDRLQAQADVDNDCHPGRFEYIIVADGIYW